MRLLTPPAAASWMHRDARTGFEVAFLEAHGTGHRVRGATTAQEGGSAWSVGYDIELDDAWTTLTVRMTNTTVDGSRERLLVRDSDNRWTVDGERRPELDGCIDVDLESSAVTNTFPIHRLDLLDGDVHDVPAAFVRADDLRVERLSQRYELTATTESGYSVGYDSPTFDFSCELRYDTAGLVLDYPGIATRIS